MTVTRQTKDDDVPLTGAEIMEHKRPSCQQEVRKCVHEAQALHKAIQGIPPSGDWSEHSDIPGVHLSIWKCFAACIKEGSDLEDFKDALAKTASRMFESMRGSSDQGSVTCYLCNKVRPQQFSGLTGPEQFQNHCVGKTHWRFLKLLQSQTDQATTVLQ